MAAYGLLGCLVGAVLLTTAQPAFAADGADDTPGFFLQVLHNLFDSRGLMRTLGQPEFAISAFVVLNVAAMQQQTSRGSVIPVEVHSRTTSAWRSKS